MARGKRIGRPGYRMPTMGKEFAKTGRAFRLNEPTGAPVPAWQRTGEVLRVVIMAHPKRRQTWEPLAHLLGALPVVDEHSRGVMWNAEQVLRALSEGLPERPGWCIVTEDDIELHPLLAENLSRLLLTIPPGVAAFSLHSDHREGSSRGWRYRMHSEILRTQFCGWRREVVPTLLEDLDAYRRAFPHLHGWDTAISRGLDARSLQSVIHAPALVQHTQTNPTGSLLGHYTRANPDFARSAPLHEWGGIGLDVFSPPERSAAQ